MVDIRLLQTSNASIVADLNGLLEQLVGGNLEEKNVKPLTVLSLYELIAHSLLIAAFEGGRVIGMATLIVVRQPSCKKCIVEDVVVHSDHRGKGIGRQLMLKVLSKCPEDADFVELTSNEIRVAARQLYAGLGFKQKNTGVFRLYLH